MKWMEFNSRLVPLTLLAITAFATAAGNLNPGQIDFCHIVQGCKLGPAQGFCTDAANRVETFSFSFDSIRCSEARLLQSRGVSPYSPQGFPLYRFLGEEYRVSYNITDTVQISRERLEYLLTDLPLAAKLISHYQKQPYTAVYLDPAHVHFQGSKGSNLHGEARLISGSFSERRLFYFGSGVADVAFWKLTGPALMDFTYWQLPVNSHSSGYQMKILVFPGNGVINKIMNLGIFRKLVFSKIRGVLVDITETAKKLNAAGGADIQRSSDWTPAEKKKVADFFKFP